MQKLIIWTSIQHYYGTIVIKFENLHQIEPNPRTSLPWIDDSILYAFPTIFFFLSNQTENQQKCIRDNEMGLFCVQKSRHFSPKKILFFFFSFDVLKKSPNFRGPENKWKENTFLLQKTMCCESIHQWERSMLCLKMENQKQVFSKSIKDFPRNNYKSPNTRKKNKNYKVRRIKVHKQTWTIHWT